MPKLHTGKRGGKYVVRKGRRVYVSKSRRRSTTRRSRRRTPKRRMSSYGFRRRAAATLCGVRNQLNCERHPTCTWSPSSNRCVSRSRIFFGPAMRPL